MADTGNHPVMVEFRWRVAAAVQRLIARRFGSRRRVLPRWSHRCVPRQNDVGPAASRLDPEYGSLTRISVGRDGHWSPRTYNEIAHIDNLVAM